MKRFALDELMRWKNASVRKPLIIQGARQVGKTWLMRTFGSEAYEQVAYINFEASTSLKTIFKDDFDVKRLLTAFEIETRIKIKPENTLIILDEIQEAEKGITSLKYFFETAPQFHIIAAGSLLGISLHQEHSFPVGKVDFLTLNPMSFKEFLWANGQQQLVELLNQRDWSLIKQFKTRFTEQLRYYYFVGGMPEAVKSFSTYNDFESVRTIQKNILTAYELDFSKHAPAEIVPRIRMMWHAIVTQLAKENRKFIYGHVKQGGRAKDFELALAWLTDCGLVHKVHRVTKPALPLAAYQDNASFKLFLVDVGLLGAMGSLSPQTILDGNEIFSEFKGAMAEQFVLQHLMNEKNVSVFYWSSDTSLAELDFVIQKGDQIIPVEVKAEENLHAKSLKSYYQKFNPIISVRTSLSDYRQDDWLTNIPLYAFENLPF